MTQSGQKSQRHLDYEPAQICRPKLTFANFSANVQTTDKRLEEKRCGHELEWQRRGGSKDNEPSNVLKMRERG